MNYIGSKFSILNFIDETIEDFIKPNKDKNNLILCDIFSGTASVGKYFKKKNYNIISNDIQVYSYITAKHYIENNEEITFKKLKENNIEDVFNYLNNIEGIEGFIYNNYSMTGTKDKEYQRLYFTDENAKKIDAIRIKIEKWKEEKLIFENEYYYLIASLIESADKVANTASVYEAYLKELKKSATKTMVLEPVETIISSIKRDYVVYNQDCNQLIKEISGDILYMDPPYNTRKYDTNYHMLETIALYDNPEIKGKAGIRCETTKKSKYCIKKEAANTFEELVKNAKFKYILLSYNDEGIIPIEEIKKIMSKYGNYKCYERKHKRYKADKNREYLKNYTIEYIHCLEKTNFE